MPTDILKIFQMQKDVPKKINLQYSKPHSEWLYCEEISLENKRSAKPS